MRLLLLGTAVAVAIASPGFNGETRYVRRIAENVCPSALCRMTNKDHGTEVDRGTLVNELRSNLGGRVFQSYGDFLDFVSVDTETFAIFGDGNGIKITVPRGVENKAANWQGYLRPSCDETISTSLEFGKSYCGISRIDCALFGFNKPLAHNIHPFIGIAVYGTAEMVDEAVESNRAAAASRPTIPAAAPARQTTNIIVAPSAAQSPPINPRPVSTPTPTLPVSTGGGASSFEKGHNDRVIWETWFRGLVGEQQDGALCWASTRSTNARGSCHGDIDFMTGVNSAKAFLDPVDANRLTDPAYRLGFNTYP